MAVGVAADASEGRKPSEQLRLESVGRLSGVVSLESSGEVWLREAASGFDEAGAASAAAIVAAAAAR